VLNQLKIGLGKRSMLLVFYCCGNLCSKFSATHIFQAHSPAGTGLTIRHTLTSQLPSNSGRQPNQDGDGSFPPIMVLQLHALPLRKLPNNPRIRQMCARSAASHFQTSLSSSSSSLPRITREHQNEVKLIKCLEACHVVFSTDIQLGGWIKIHCYC